MLALYASSSREQRRTSRASPTDAPHGSLRPVPVPRERPRRAATGAWPESNLRDPAPSPGRRGGRTETPTPPYLSPSGPMTVFRSGSPTGRIRDGDGRRRSRQLDHGRKREKSRKAGSENAPTRCAGEAAGPLFSPRMKPAIIERFFADRLWRHGCSASQPES